MIKPEEVYKIGRLGKAHGVKGEVSFLFDDDIFDRVDTDYLVLDIDGILVPFFMEEYRFRNDTVCLVKFCDIDTQQRAQELTGCDVYFPRALAEEADDDLSLASLVGFTIINDGGGKATAYTVPDGSPVGIISSIDDTTANILFELDNGRLIPANDDLIVDIDTEHRQIRMNIPEGLLDI
jgi:16S rRNA processing protein RimM